MIISAIIVLLSGTSFAISVSESDMIFSAKIHTPVEIPDISIDRSETIIENGVLLHGNIPYSGRVHRTANNGQLNLVTEYLNGLKHGTSESRYENGDRAEVRHYEYGHKTDVHIGWWPNGRMKFSYGFSEGRYEGAFLEWYSSGQQATAFNYEDGVEIGTQRAWRSNGKLYINLVYKNGKRYGVLRTKPCFQIVDGQRNSLEEPDEAF